MAKAKEADKAKKEASTQVIKGRLGQDVEYGITEKSREEFAKFNVAVTKGKETQWFNNVSAFDNAMAKLKDARKGDWVEVEVKTSLSDKLDKNKKPYENHLAKKVTVMPIRSIKGNVAIGKDKPNQLEVKTLPNSSTKAVEFSLGKASDDSLIRVVGYGDRMADEMKDLERGDFIKIKGHQENKTWVDKGTGEEKTMEVFYADKVDVLAKAKDIKKEDKKEQDQSKGVS